MLKILVQLMKRYTNIYFKDLKIISLKLELIVLTLPISSLTEQKYIYGTYPFIKTINIENLIKIK